MALSVFPDQWGPRVGLSNCKQSAVVCAAIQPALQWETRTIGSGLREHSDNQIRPLKPDNRPEMTKEYTRWETEEEDALTENKGD